MSQGKEKFSVDILSTCRSAQLHNPILVDTKVWVKLANRYSAQHNSQ